MRSKIIFIIALILPLIGCMKSMDVDYIASHQAPKNVFSFSIPFKLVFDTDKQRHAIQ